MDYKIGPAVASGGVWGGLVLTATDLASHILNFLAPAIALSLLCVLAGRALVRSGMPMLVWWVQAAVNMVLCSTVLLAGLWAFGQDGKMASYVAMVVFCATSQWLMLRGWSR